WLSSGPSAPSPPPPDAAAARSVASSPILAAAKAAVDDNVCALVPGATETYTIVVTNSGNADATNVNLSDGIPANTSLVAGSLTSSDPTDVLTEANPLSVAMGTLAGGGASTTIGFKVKLNTPLAGGIVISNQATATANGGISIVSDDPSTPAPNDPT